ncbi:MAG: HAMP domain-containing histidine kinase [Ruminococcaceae bacterium]|nr:HAMP domain-containing histidine kinase [Oscillospiraceae bacterium]
MKKRQIIKSRKLWIIFTFLTFSVMSVSVMVTSFCLLVAFERGLLSPRFGISAFAPFSVTSIAVATVLSMFVSRAMLYPVRDFSDAAKRISKGDFSKKLNENNLIEEIASASKNFNLMMTELEKLEGFRSEFAASVSHEFKTPLGKIKGYAELLREGDLSLEEKENCINQIVSGVDKLNAMSEKMLSLARFENQQIVLNKSKFSLDEQLRQCFLLFETRWSEKEIEPSFELEEFDYFGDSNLLSHIWTNIFDNAIKFTPNGGNINIELKKEKRYAVVTVFNSGEGIKEKDISHIFEKFYQVDRSRNDRGSGLGLSLVKRIVELCGGEISVKSELGRGTEFKVYLPLSEI